MRTGIVKMPKWVLKAAVAAAVASQFAVESQAGLFKIDFGQSENERVPVDADGNPTKAPPLLVDWTVIPTWTFADPNANVTDGSAGSKGTANADGTEVTWKLIDSSVSPKANVTLTILDNKKLALALNADNPPYMLGQTANNPTKEEINVVYDGVYVPAIVKDDYLYRAPDAAGSESLMRIANLDPGTYNVTVFEGRSSDSDGRHGKVWVDDLIGAKEPATQNTGNYSGVDDSGTKLYKGQPRTVTVTLKAGEYLWFAEIEDNSGGVSGVIVRGLPAAVASVSLVGSATVNGPYTAVTDATVDTAAKSIKVSIAGSARFFRVQGSDKIVSSSLGGTVLEIKYQ